MVCKACKDKGSVTIHDIIAGIAVEYDAPCPVCTDIIEILQSIKDSAVKRTKSVLIPGKGIDDEDEEPCDLEIEDEITDTTIEDILNK